MATSVIFVQIFYGHTSMQPFLMRKHHINWMEPIGWPNWSWGAIPPNQLVLILNLSPEHNHVTKALVCFKPCPFQAAKKTLNCHFSIWQHLSQKTLFTFVASGRRATAHSAQ